jgi:chaperonin cofactor prefoldin
VEDIEKKLKNLEDQVEDLKVKMTETDSELQKEHFRTMMNVF